MLFREPNEKKLFLTAVIVFALFSKAGGPGMRYMSLVFSMVNDRTLATDRYFRELNKDDVAYYKGHFYLGAQPGPAVIAAPFYALIRPFVGWMHSKARLFAVTLVLNFFVNVLPMAFCGVLLYRILRATGISPGDSVTASLIFYFGAMPFAYATAFEVGDSMGMMFCLAGYYAIRMSGERPGVRDAAAVGVCLGLAVCMGFPTVPVVVVLGLVALVQLRAPSRVAIAVAAGAVFIILLLIYYRMCFGSFFTTYLPHLYLDEFVRQHEGGTVKAPNPGHILALTFLPSRGFFLYMPAMLLAFWSFRGRGRSASGMDLYLPWVIFLAGLLFDASVADWIGGSSWGPRYLLATAPFMIVAVAAGLSAVPVWVKWPLVFASMIINAVGSCGVPHGRMLHWYFTGFVNEGWTPQIPLAQHIVLYSRIFPEHLMTGRVVFGVSLLIAGATAVLLWFLWRSPKKPGG